MSALGPASSYIDPVDAAGSWARFRVDDPRRCLALLRELRQGDLPLQLGVVHGPPLVAVLWAVDEPQLRLHFSADAVHTPASLLQQLLTAPEPWAAAYLGDSKLQWALHGLRIDAEPLPGSISGDSRLRLQALLPTHLYLLPRRHALRTRHGRHRGPQLRFRHPLAPAQVLTLAALDISSGGCALWKPGSVIALAPGLVLDNVELQLDAHTLLYADLRVQHVTRRSSDPDSGARVGCSWLNLPASSAVVLQRWLEAGNGPDPLMRLQLD
jgi:hypothetical protein